MGQHGFGGVVGAEHVDVDDGFEGVGGELGEGREKIACCAGAGGGKGGGWLGFWVCQDGFSYMQKSMPPSSFTQLSTA